MAAACSAFGLRGCGPCGEGADGTAGRWGSRSPALLSVTTKLPLSAVLHYSRDSSKFWAWFQIRFSQTLCHLEAGCQVSVWFPTRSKVVMQKIIAGDMGIAGSL